MAQNFTPVDCWRAVPDWTSQWQQMMTQPMKWMETATQAQTNMSKAVDVQRKALDNHAAMQDMMTQSLGIYHEMAKMQMEMMQLGMKWMQMWAVR